EALALRVPLQERSRPQRDAGHQRGRRYAMAELDVARARLATADAIEEVPRMVGVLDARRHLARLDHRLAVGAIASLLHSVDGTASRELVGQDHVRHDLITRRAEVKRPLGAAELD